MFYGTDNIRVYLAHSSRFVVAAALAAAPDGSDRARPNPSVFWQQLLVVIVVVAPYFGIGVVRVACFFER